MLRRVAPLFAISLIWGLCGCGGGGGGGSFTGAARVIVSADPSTVDSGDRARVEVHISEVHPNGIVLKLRFPVELSYVPESAFLDVDDNEFDVSPTVNATAEDDENFLVFYFEENDFNQDLEGTLVLELEGTDDLNDGRLEVDADVDDPRISNNEEFDINNPQFEAEDSTGIEVEA